MVSTLSRIRTGPESSKSRKYSQEATSTEDEPEREGRSLAITHHEVILQWAEERVGVSATVNGAGNGDHLGELRIDSAVRNDKLRHTTWEKGLKPPFPGPELHLPKQRSDSQEPNSLRPENPGRVRRLSCLPLHRQPSTGP